MMKKFGIFPALAMLAGSLMANAPALAATLKIGDPAPPLQTAKWVQGDPVQGFGSNHVYIVEFWATWCGPCRASIPHLNEIWQKYKDKDLIVIGQDVWEQDESGVPAFVSKMGDTMTYRVALDDKSQEKDGAMAVNWMKAADRNGIPTAFIVNREGKIAWIGHPMALQESDLEQILADKFDVAAYAREYEQQQQEQDKRQALTQTLAKAIKDADWDTADATLTEIENSMPEQARYQAAVVHIQILIGRKDFAGAYKLAGSSSDTHLDNANLQNQLAWALAIGKGVDRQGLELAEKIAERGNNASNGKAPQMLDTLARIQFMNGKTNDAVATEQKAVDLAPDEMKTYLQQFLTAYQQGKLPEINQ